MTVLEVAGLGAGYGSLQVLWDAGLTVQPGEVAALIGPNGAGKSSFLAAVAGILPATSGTVQLGGVDVTRAGAPERLRAGLAWVPSGRNVFGSFTVQDNLELSAWLARCDATAVRDVQAIFPMLAERSGVRAGRLSGGQQQILSIARALVRRPRVAMLDEPSVGLGPQIVATMAQAIARLRTTGISFVVTEQNVSWLAPLVDRTFLMAGGRLSEVRDRNVISDRALLRDAFFGTGPQPLGTGPQPQRGGADSHED
jgi:branched-chain amino acid transport system ATP-binding protein